MKNYCVINTGNQSYYKYDFGWIELAFSRFGWAWYKLWTLSLVVEIKTLIW